MVAEPLVPRVAGSLADAFGERVAALRDEAMALWEATPARLPAFGPVVGPRRRWANARATAWLIDDVARRVERCPDEPAARAAWRRALRERLLDFGEARLGWPPGYRRLIFADAYYDASVAFVRAARAFDPTLALDELLQALRNVWIGNSLQMLLDLPVESTPALFAYSMLYPLTDNQLDDPALAPAAKRAASERLGRRLAGQPIVAGDAREAAVFRLVATIEEELPRRRFPAAWQSLLAIHRGQVASLDQHDGRELDDADLLAISCEKGGASVLADLYLVAGEPTAEAERFAFGYGVFLQLLDDLQDVAGDLEAGHETLFTRAARRGALDEPAARLAAFIDAALDRDPRFAGPAFADRQDLIRRNCRALWVGALAEQRRRFGRPFRRAVARRWPIGLGRMSRLRRRAMRRYREALAVVRRRRGTDSLLELLL